MALLFRSGVPLGLSTVVEVVIDLTALGLLVGESIILENLNLPQINKTTWKRDQEKQMFTTIAKIDNKFYSSYNISLTFYTNVKHFFNVQIYFQIFIMPNKGSKSSHVMK